MKIVLCVCIISAGEVISKVRWVFKSDFSFEILSIALPNFTVLISTNNYFLK